MKAERAMLRSLLTRAPTREMQRPNESWQQSLLAGVEDLRALALESRGPQAGARWDSEVDLVRDWTGTREELIAKVG